MTWQRIALVALQIAGGISLLAYPAILVASVMGMAAEGPKGYRRLVSALPYLALSAYPIVWLGLFTWSWKALARGATAEAFTASSIPLAISLGCVAWYLKSEARDRAKRASKRS